MQLYWRATIFNILWFDRFDLNWDSCQFCFSGNKFISHVFAQGYSSRYTCIVLYKQYTLIYICIYIYD